MKNLNEYIDQWFGKQDKNLDFLPVWQENLVRSESEIKAFELWKLSDLPAVMQNELFATYEKNKVDIKSKAYRFIDKDLSGGFMMYVQKSEFSEQDFTFFFDFLKEKVQCLNYKAQLSDKRFFNRKNFAEEIHRHYLKPRLEFDKNNKANQLFGNIHLELYKRNDELIQLKFLVTAYQDHNYQKAQTFDALFQFLCEE